MAVKDGCKKVQYVLKAETAEAVKRDAKELGMSASAYVNMVLLSVSRAADAFDADKACDLFAQVIADCYAAQDETKGLSKSNDKK